MIFNQRPKRCHHQIFQEDHQCTKLDKTFRCSSGVCYNITAVYSCSFDMNDTDPPLDCENKRNCVELQGMYECEMGKCR